MSNNETIDTSLRGVPKALYERIKEAAKQEFNGIGISTNQMMVVLLQEAMAQRERKTRGSDSIEEHIDDLVEVG